jgi:hypothetical protein
MHRTSIVALVALAFLASCASTPLRGPRRLTLAARPRPEVTAPSGCGAQGTPRICALARFDASREIVEVTLRIEPDVLPAPRRDVVLAFRGEHHEEHVRLVNDRPWPRSLGPVEAAVELHYRVALSRTPAHREGASFPRAGGWHLTGSTFLPDVIVDGEQVHAPATMVLDPGELPLWTAAGGERRAFDADSLARLADEAYEIGPVLVARRATGASELLVVTSGDGAKLSASADVLERALRGLAAHLGPPPAETVLFALHDEDAPVWAERLGASVVQMGRDPMPRDAFSPRAALAVHELAQLWSPGTHEIADDWLEEGIADYFTVLALAELTEAPRAATARVVLRNHLRHVEHAEREGRASHAGLSLGFCLDEQLRESGSSLGAVLRTTLAREQRELGADALLEDLAAISPSSASYLEALLASEGSFSLEECLSRYGFSARAARYDGPTDRALSSALGIVMMTPFTHAQGFEVAEASEGSPFAGGDVVLELEGVRVAELEDLAWALRTARGGQRIRALVRRDGDTQALSIEVPRALVDERVGRSYVELVAPPVDRARGG